MSFADAIAQRWMACRLDLGTLEATVVGTDAYPTRAAATSECFVALDTEAATIGAKPDNIFHKPTADTCAAVQPHASWDGRDAMMLHRVTPVKEADGYFTTGATTLRIEPIAKFFVLKVQTVAAPPEVQAETTTEVEIFFDGRWIKTSEAKVSRAAMAPIPEELPFPETEATITTGGGWDDVVAEFKERLRVKRKIEEEHRLKAERRAERTLRRRDRRKAKAE